MKTNVIQLAARFDRAMAAWNRAKSATRDALTTTPFDLAYYQRCSAIDDQLWTPVYVLAEQLYDLRNPTS